jgi:hypothetical protein
MAINNTRFEIEICGDWPNLIEKYAHHNIKDRILVGYGFLIIETMFAKHS